MDWRKSSHSYNGSSCAEWRCASGECVQVRDSRDPDGPQLRFTRAAWRDFTRRLKDAG